MTAREKFKIGDWVLVRSAERPDEGWLNSDRRPTLADAWSVLQHAREREIEIVAWRVLPRGEVCMLRWCECGEVAIASPP